MATKLDAQGLTNLLAGMPRASLAQLPTPLHPLPNFSQYLDGCDVWMKRDDLTGLEGGGNKTRKLEFLLGDALEKEAELVVTAGAIQSNHTRQTAAAAAKLGLKCALLHFGWVGDAGPTYRTTGNILLSSLMGADLYIDDTRRPIEDQSPLFSFDERLKAAGHKTYLVPNGASLHPLGGLGYMACVAEIMLQCAQIGTRFDYVVHCTGSSSTQAGLLAGFAALGEPVPVIGIADDDETEIKQRRVHKLANETLATVELDVEVPMADVEVIASDDNAYGQSDRRTYEVIRQFAQAEGLVIDPVYEGKAVRGLLALADAGRFEPGSRILLMHLGGGPAVHGYAETFGAPELIPVA